MAKPSVLFVSSCSITPETLIGQVLNSNADEKEVIDENITAFPWHIENKYYEADVNLCAVSSKSISDENFASFVDAVVLCFDAQSATGLEYAEQWLPFLDVYSADIQILVCKSCKSEEGDDGEGICKRSAQEWCVARGYELVELEPLEEVDPEDDFPETTGVERIRQALNAHEWSNLVLKSENGAMHRLAAAIETQADQSNGHDALVESLEEMLDGDEFGDLFSHLHEIKSRMSNLSGNERKEAAEQAVRAFWRAMGGPDGEL